MNMHSRFRLLGCAIALAGLLGAGAWTEAAAQTSTATASSRRRPRRRLPVT